MQSKWIFLSSVVFLGVIVGVGCGGGSGSDGRSGTGSTAGTGGTGNGGASGTGGTGNGGAGGVGAGGSGECFVALCPDGTPDPYGCGDCVDNDDDGLVDDRDPECLGPCDDTEGPILLTGTPGETGNQCSADCYFDRGNGSGGGDCKWDRRCDPLYPKDGCPYDADLIGEINYCPDPQPENCDAGCRALTPNGCDCFGCCTFPDEELAGGYVFLGSYDGNIGTCTLADINNPLLCRPCTPAANCLNECGRCELCLGKTEIPEDCFPGTGGSGGAGGTGGTDLRCPIGKQACGLPGDPACLGGAYCLTGCCTEIIVQ